MNILQIALFIFLVQQAFYLTAIAGFPISCNSDGTSCLYFTTDMIDGQTMQDVVNGVIDGKDYKTTPIETNIDADVWQQTAVALEKVGQVLYGSVFGIVTLITFIFGRTGIGYAIGWVLQGVVYYFYAIIIINTVKNIKGDIRG